ncbi:hypothetical protein Agabi119p4_7851 [Agaricus bisporus var. burnettii]|uniref:RNA polymerase II-associated protein 1 C-terminal domain-containing protein n=1 Tax=Agaricus bisporus var. burnettii TaxID=192524 RepID=A0A8H7C8J4_AGABI|nr:hypothetical protein Agabi119p4_7851 [Agaricus bisporus var. burnettii]
MSAENEMRVAAMNDEAREAEKQEILKRFGAEIGDILMRARRARETNTIQGRRPTEGVNTAMSIFPQPLKDLPEVPITEDEPSPSRLSGRGFSPPPALSRPNSRPSSRSDRKLRFAGLNPNDVYVYESAPSSPKKRPLALPPALNDGTAVSLGQFQGDIVPRANVSDHESTLKRPGPAKEGVVDEPEVGTAEHIRRRYFPNAPVNDPNLAWMEAETLSEPSHHPKSLRFDLHGNVIPLSVGRTLPSHLGLHHHAEGSVAGYTLDDIFLLSRSTVPAQRATMLGVLVRIVVNLGKAKRGELSDLDEILPQAEGIRKRVMAAGVEAMNERGGVGARAIEVVWASIVGWDEDVSVLEGVELQQDPETVIASLQLDFFLRQVTTLLQQGDILPESLNQLLAVLQRLGQQSNKIADALVQTPQLLTAVLHTFLLTPIPPRKDGPLPEPAAIQLIITLISASRTNAQSITEVTDSLLRFITPLPPSSLFPPALASGLLVLTLRLYAALASYGLYANITTTAMEPFSQLGRYALSLACSSQKVQVAWLNLLRIWMVCAVDPHRTTPDHDILWSQIVGWGWKDDVARFSAGLDSRQENFSLWRMVWRVQAQWLEGSKVNSVRGGEVERTELMDKVRDGFLSGTERQVVIAAIDGFRKEMRVENTTRDLERVAFYAGILDSAIRLWLACLPPHLVGQLSSPPFDLPFPLISEACAELVVHPLWDCVSSKEVDTRNYVHARQLSGLLIAYLSLSRRLPGIPEELWLAQAFSIIGRLLPGDEHDAVNIINEISSLVTSDWVNQRQIFTPTVIWEKGGLSILRPFFLHTIRPKKKSRIAPLLVTPRSIATSSTLRLPMVSQRRGFGLPLHSDWTLTPLNHLLRSAESQVFKSLPAEWDSSELEVTRATWFLSNFARDVLTRFSLRRFALSREEAVFGCMRVFMLEHEQPANDSSVEVFRDPVVEKLMNQMLGPYSYTASHQPFAEAPHLEEVAARFLGMSTPFFQFYTDFVALYDAISFSNPTFAKLLLPPTSMRCAIDYRKQLWGDFSHILKTITTPCEETLSSDLKEYLYPIEDDPQLIGTFLQVLLKEPLQGMCRFVAVHHIASSIWPDLRDENSSNETRAEKLIKAVATQGSIEVVKEVTTYWQTSLGTICLPPECFERGSAVASARFGWITKLGDEAVTERLRGLLT